MLVFIYSYKGYTITDLHNGKFYITYPNDQKPCIYTFSLEKAYNFIDSMEA